MKRFLIAALGVLASIVLAIFTGKSMEQSQQARRDKKAQQKIAEVYRDSETEYDNEVDNGRRDDARSHFE